MNIPPVGIESSSVASANRAPAPSVADKPSSQAAAPLRAQAVRSGAPEELAPGSRPEDLAERTEKAVEKISRFVEYAASDLQFTVDEETEVPVVKVVDRTTKEVIRQIPSEEAIEISQALDKLNGLLIRNQA